MIAYSHASTSITPRAIWPRRLAVALCLVALPLVAGGCRGSDSTPPGAEQQAQSPPPPATATEAATTRAPVPARSSEDPLVDPPDGPFPSMGGDDGATAPTVVQTRYTRDIEGTGKLYAVLETSAGTIRCRLYEDEAPRTVDNFVGLARGTKPWRDPRTGETVKRPLYDGLVFHRVIPGLLVQSGDPTGTGNGHPGFFIEDEFADGLSHNQAGVLSMAQSRPDGNGSQFFITDAPAQQFDGRYPIFGLCGNTDVVRTIANAETGDSRTHRPKEPVVLRSVRFERGH